MLLEQIAAYGARDAARELPECVVHHGKRAVLDWFAALYPGTQVAPCLTLMQAHRSEMGFGRSRLPGHVCSAFPATAAWINGSASHTVEFDDIFKDAVYHPGCPVISAALAVADDLDASGQALLNAVVVGYEISTRLGAAVQPSHYSFFHTTGTVGCMGAAAAVAALACPGDSSVMAHAISTATSFASGLQQAFRSDAMTKALHAGHAAAVGVRAGLAAASGLTGVHDILEGDAGFGRAMSDTVNWSVATQGLGTHYNITRITQKNHGCCGHTFAAIDAVLALQERHHINPDAIASISVSTYRAALNVTGNLNPVTAFEAKFSMAYVISHALLYGSVRLNAFDASRLQDPVIRRVMKKVALHEDVALTDTFPGQRAANVTITLIDGTALSHFSPYRRGDPELPLSDTELDDKFTELVAPVIGQSNAAQLRHQIWNLDRMSVRELAVR
jgi:2-methylcitrate dehydratase PrpD